ncbi:hypothetical protein APUTEX25_001325 [Auxenochlorella protothecoides]|uniref:Amino acid transporter transmembrane domain-containing protein n=1 Tax=Auxenochlorella protothecoides TaxID=3075 RepID=A0A3M7L187_AUXPR|nr:hypothetical protein APUTEX25_001325 [Auxenochlorella protothecoides]|eukprot:RMZ56478.1 hypothetical protein APUTEX25_001325 [Auxenochlorella protothecoides]
MPEVVLEHWPHPRAESSSRAFTSALITLTLSILGSSVLPVPYAFSRTGVLLGLLTALAVSLANSLTGTLLVRAAGACGTSSYEALAETLGGPRWRAFTQSWLVLLLFGTLCGDFALVADTGRLAVGKLAGSAAPHWLLAGQGRVIVALLGLGLVLPLSCLKHIRKLEQAAAAGVALVGVLTVIIIRRCVADDFPAVRSGELDLFHVRLTPDLPEAIGVLSFAFYVHPMLLPMLAEMPAGARGVALTARANQLVTSGVALAIYSVVGVFAAARYGLATGGDVLVNEWLGGAWDGALDAGMALYLALSMVPIVLTLRLQLDALILGPGRRTSRAHTMQVTAASVLSSLGVALCFPTAAEKMFAITGASAVCVVCYALPVAFHLRLFYRPASAVARCASVPDLAPSAQHALLGTSLGPDANQHNASTLSLAGWGRPGSPASTAPSTGSARLASAEHAASLAHWADLDDKLAGLEPGPVTLEYPSVHSVRQEPSVARRAAAMTQHVVLPLLVLVLGFLASGVGLVLAIQQLLAS